MKLTRSILSLILALVLVFSLGAGVFAADYPESGFVDVPRSEWFAEAVDYAKAEGLMNGVGDNRFDPHGAVTRAMVVTVLYRAASEPDVTGVESKFSDVTDPKAWFYNAVLWGAEKGIVNGMGNGTFAPNAPITREQMATMIIRYALVTADEGSSLMAELAQRDPDGAVALQMLMNGIDPKLAEGFPAVADFKGFQDAASISPYARWNVLFCRLTGIMKGDEAGTFRPQATLSRAECAQTFLNVSDLADSVIAQ